MQPNAGFGISAGFFILPLLYMLLVAAVVIVMTIAAWRIMKAQEATASALQQIADSFRTRST